MSLWIILGSLTAFYSAALWLFFLGLGKLPKGRNGTTPSVSVVMAARNEEEHIRPCLESLVRQGYSGKYDITVADDQSTDRTAEIVRELAEQHPHVRLIRIQETQRGWAPKKFALNQAIQNSTGEIICATDADCTMPPTWIQGLVRQFEPSVGMVVGLVNIKRIKGRGSLWVRLQALELFSLFLAAAGAIGKRMAYSAMGCNLAYRREAFRQAGGFGKIKHLASGDDDLLLQQLVAATPWETRFCSDPGTFVSTEPMPNLRAFFRQRRRWASKAPHQRRSLLCLLVVTFLLNLSLLTAIPVTLFVGRWAGPSLTCLAVKALSEMALLWRGTRLLGGKELLGIFPLWELAHIPYMVLSGVAGLAGGFAWKGRRYAGQDRLQEGRIS
jgi:cellulose synthase/poly-beta-1,6-N-acetylglucosamine synthase-like glycosyltransferase